MTETTPTSTCDWCRKPNASHTEDQHPLPTDHPDYDAFYDASDSDLLAYVANALRPL